MSGVHIVGVSKEVPPYRRNTKEILPFVELWLSEQEERFKRKVIKIFEGAGVDHRYGIMNIEEVFTATSFEEKNAIYVREIKKLGSTVLQKALEKNGWEPGLYHYGKLHGDHDPIRRCVFDQ